MANGCKYWHYDENLLTSSVVIVFHNEGWSTLMRTVHSVIKRTPRKYLAEIVLIDDFSNKEHLKERLDEYIKMWNGLVKVFRNERREGLIQARSIGAQKAKLGQVLIYLDAHCEVAVNWYAPLVAPISKDRTTCTVPLIDYIDGNDYSIEPQQGGDEDGFARGAWDWSLLWKRIPLNHKEKAKRKHKTEPYRSPAMAGGLFAIEREFFFELGLYDPGLQIWGGENFEISYKIWQCGGKLLFVPCSRVGHIYRLEGWQGNPPPVYVGSSPTLKNYIRVVEVWWDEYKDYFYASRPESKALPYGDISELKKFREDHNCKSFKWFMEEIAYDITSHYPLPPRNIDWGEIRGLETAYCIDSMGKTNGGFVELGPCHRMGGNQLFRINEVNQLMQYDQCLTKGPDGSKVMITHCNLNEFKEWQYIKAPLDSGPGRKHYPLFQRQRWEDLAFGRATAGLGAQSELPLPGRVPEAPSEERRRAGIPVDPGAQEDRDMNGFTPEEMSRGNASFSKRIQKSISQKKVKIELDKSARHLYICDYHKNLIQSVRNRRKRKGSDDDGGDSPVQDIDTPEIVGCHFRSIPVNEKDTLTYFIYSVKNDKNKSDLKVDSGVH
ncbi:N-acetylgalactosaminyltransferase 7 [Tupaia chinensis]|uniref:Polypeptide N-acetylgalactosaminyltransferase n=2 Tax=Euarchontoglires TaxID=314146 RepID=L9KZ05_TUPCH|nr:N-acetylgalactosaminyltransferase 7 [Tupaia chinensis]